MRAERILLLCLLALAATMGCQSSLAQSPTRVRDQQHAFDFHFGTWRTHILSRRSTPSGAAQWVRMTGTVIDQPLWNGRANLEKIEASGPASHFQGLTLFLYDPKSGQWSQQFAGSGDGVMQEPVYGEFSNGRGVFYGWSGSGGRKTLERDVWSDITPTSYHFEIASSADGGKTWTTGFIAQLRRLKKDPDYGTPLGAGSGPEHDFDFNMGHWNTRIRAVLNPLSSPGAWSNLEGTHSVYRVWDDWADIGQLEVDGPRGHIEYLALRMYDRETHQWRVYFANSSSGTLAPPMVGQFENGAGTFVGLDDVEGKTVLIRNVWSGITAKSCRQDWAISTDGGKTWVPTWISTDTLGS
ncbi:MAG: hypothetical protein KGJ72_09830 [Gammaproteobacteria bacterium]|nr:hypothetical protein [Gammaproteobacteria bacterium]